MKSIFQIIRETLLAEGVSGEVVERAEIRVREGFGGRRIYIQRTPEADRDRVRELIRAGVKPRTARKKIRG